MAGFWFLGARIFTLAIATFDDHNALLFPLSYSYFAGWWLLFLAPLSGTRLGASCNALGPLSWAVHSQLALVSVPRLLDTTRPCHWAASGSSL